MPSGSPTQREIAGSVAHISIVGGSRQTPATMARKTMPKTPSPPQAV
jgi:hypothetical protein